jgi:hypothetical protein
VWVEVADDDVVGECGVVVWVACVGGGVSSRPCAGVTYVGGVGAVSTEAPATEPPQSASEPSHGGPAYPWETFLSGLGGEVGREELARELVADEVRAILPAALDMVDAAIARGELSTDGEAVRAASRHSNENKSVNSATAANQAAENSGGEERPTNEEKVAEFAAAYPVRATSPLAESDGVSLRRDYAHVETEEWTENQPDIPELEVTNPAKGETVTDVSAVEWGEAVRTLLEKYERTKQTTINLEKGSWRTPERHAEFSVQAENRWFASYQKKYFAQLDGWLRELCGGERPSGMPTAASFEEPRIALLTRSASSKPEGERVGPVTHAKELQGSWEPVYHTLRNTLRAEGYELGEDWQYDRRLEPHTGKRGNDAGVNEAYAHEHIILVVDGDVTADDLRPVMDKHVEACEWAGEEAHGEEAIEVREPDELNDVAAYVADYCSIEPVELWEREPAYVGWAAAMDAGNIRTVSRSEAAREAAKADKCRQRYISGESQQSEPHGARVTNLGGERVCFHCESSHDISQEGTLAGERMDGPTAATDGGVEVLDAEAREERLQDKWGEAEWEDAYGNTRSCGGAEAAARVGESPQRRQRREQVERELERDPEATARQVVARRTLPPDCMELVEEVRAGIDREAVVGFDNRVPDWHVRSVTVEGEERPASAGNGIDMVEVMDVRQRLREGAGIEATQRYRCDCGVAAYGRDMVAHLGSHGIDEPERAGEVIDQESV